MAIFPIPIWYLIGILVVANTSTAMRDISIDGIVCSQGKESNNCGNIQSIQWACSISAGILTSLAGGYIAEHYSYRLSFALIIPAYLITLYLAIMFKESNKAKEILGNYVYRVHVKKSLWHHVKSYKSLFTNKTFLVCALMVFAYNFSPRFGTALFFVQRDSFHWSATFIGIITAIESSLSVIGCLLYWKYNKKFNVYQIFLWSIPAGILCNICFLYYTPTSALIYIVYGFFWMFFGLNCLTYMANNTIKGKETTSFALLCAVSNIGGMVSNISGGWLFDVAGLDTTIIIAAICPVLIIPLLKYTKNKVE
jgi:predicted MFS family arabinose efflux permease